EPSHGRGRVAVRPGAPAARRLDALLRRARHRGAGRPDPGPAAAVRARGGDAVTGVADRAPATPTRSATTFERIAAIPRRDLSIELSYQFNLLARGAAVFSTVFTFFFIGKIVDPHALGSYGDHYFEFALVGIMVATFSAVGLATFTDTIRSEQEAGTLEVL